MTRTPLTHNNQFSPWTAEIDFGLDQTTARPTSRPHIPKMATELTVQSERAFQKQPHSEFFPWKTAATAGSWELATGANEAQSSSTPRPRSSLRVLVRVAGDGIRMSVWVSGPPSLPLRASTSVRYETHALPNRTICTECTRRYRFPAGGDGHRDEEMGMLGQGTVVDWMFSLQTRSAPSPAWFRSAAVS